MSTSPTKKTIKMKLPMISTAEKAMESGMVRMRCQKVSGRHDLGGGFTHERGDGNDGVAVGAQRIDERTQRSDGGGAVAAAIVHEDDGAAELRLALHGVELGED